MTATQELTLRTAYLHPMPTYIHLANLVVEKQAVVAKYPGGVVALRSRFAVDDPENYHQEDGELFSISAMNADELYDLVKELRDLDFVFNEENAERNEFVLLLRYGGPHLRPAWLRRNALHAWHSTCPAALQAKAERLGRTFMDELVAMQERGEQVFGMLVE